MLDVLLWAFVQRGRVRVFLENEDGSFYSLAFGSRKKSTILNIPLDYNFGVACRSWNGLRTFLLSF